MHHHDHYHSSDCYFILFFWRSGEKNGAFVMRTAALERYVWEEGGWGMGDGGAELIVRSTYSHMLAFVCVSLKSPCRCKIQANLFVVGRLARGNKDPV